MRKQKLKTRNEKVETKNEKREITNQNEQFKKITQLKKLTLKN